MQGPVPKGRKKLNAIQGPEGPCPLRKSTSTSGCFIHRGLDALVPDCYKTRPIGGFCATYSAVP